MNVAAMARLAKLSPSEIPRGAETLARRERFVSDQGDLDYLDRPKITIVVLDVRALDR